MTYIKQNGNNKKIESLEQIRRAKSYMDYYERNIVDDKDRNCYLDIAKGISILVVLLSHTSYIYLQKYLFGFFLPIFFFISGYLYKEAPIKEQIIKRARNILKPYFIINFILLITTCIEFIIKGNFPAGFILRAVGGILYGRYMLGADLNNPIILFQECHNHPLWFLPAMFCASCSMYIYKALENIKDSNFLKLCVVIICMATAKLMNNLTILLPWSIDTLPVFLLFMLAGDWYKNIEKKRENFSRVFTIIVYIFLIFIYIVLCHDNYNIAIRDYGLGIFVYLIRGIIGSILLISLIKMFNRFFRYGILNMVGKYSLQLMGYHVLFFDLIDGVILKYISRWIQETNINSMVYSILKTLIATVVIIIFTRLFQSILQKVKIDSKV